MFILKCVKYKGSFKIIWGAERKDSKDITNTAAIQSKLCNRELGTGKALDSTATHCKCKVLFE